MKWYDKVFNIFFAITHTFLIIITLIEVGMRMYVGLFDRVFWALLAVSSYLIARSLYGNVANLEPISFMFKKKVKE